ncbi:SAF domain-containing protein [Frankia sp. AgKG'84/4]|nr:SAF domain-containing protein [Frankia sp. AgKG'84/4]
MGVVLVVVCVAVFVVVGGRRDGRREVLLVTRAVPAGHLLAVGDVRAVSVVADPGVDLVPAGRAAEVVGRPAAVPLMAGSFLSAGSVGRRLLPEGARLVGASLKAGAFPPGLAAGDRVSVLVTGDTAGPSDGGVSVAPAGSSVDGVVATVEEGPAGSGGLVVSVQVGSGDADRVARAAAAGQVVLVLRGSR